MGTVDNKHKALTCLYSLEPTPIDNYYQYYAEYHEDDDDNTIITSNLKENKCEKSGTIAQEIKEQNLKTLDKNSGDRGVDPLHTPHRAIWADDQSLLKAAESRGRAGVSSEYTRAVV